MNKKCYIFDVDGTLTEPRRPVTKKFKKSFMKWAKDKEIYISTGSDFAKTIEQIPQEMLNCFKLIHCCMGNEIRTPLGTIIKSNKIDIPESLNKDLLEYIDDSPFHYRTGNHMEFRSGMLNFSIVGRNADEDQRKEYNLWDTENKERLELAAYVNKNYPHLEASVGGSISIDIIEKGKDKGQIVEKLVSLGFKEIEFIGDKCFPGGNDYGVVRELRKTKNIKWRSFNVINPDETLKFILSNYI